MIPFKKWKLSYTSLWHVHQQNRKKDKNNVGTCKPRNIQLPSKHFTLRIILMRKTKLVISGETPCINCLLSDKLKWSSTVRSSIFHIHCISMYICTLDVSSFTAGTATTSTMFVRRALDDRSTVPVHKFPRWYANFCERYREWSFSPALITRFSRSRMNNYVAVFQERRLIRQKPESVPSYTDRKFAIPICKWSKRVLIVSPD